MEKAIDYSNRTGKQKYRKERRADEASNPAPCYPSPICFKEVIVASDKTCKTCDFHQATKMCKQITEYDGYCSNPDMKEYSNVEATNNNFGYNLHRKKGGK
jgi:hypothetical protein